MKGVCVLMVAFSIRGTTFGHGGGLLNERTEGRERAGDDDYVHFSPGYSQVSRGEMDVWTISSLRIPDHEGGRIVCDRTH